MTLLDQLMAQALYTAYRLASYALVNLVDDPALLAIIFC